MRWQLGLIFFLFAYVWAEEEQDEEPVEEEAVKEEFKDLSHGFGTDIEWADFSKATELSKELKKPVFVLIHKTWCGACKQLKNSFKTSPKHHDFVKLSRKFVMVNLEDDEEPEDDKFAPDGRYIPRLYFLKGDDVLDVKNKNYPKNLYYFPQLQDVIKAMEEALKLHDKGEKTEEKVEEEKPKEETKKTDSKKKEETKKTETKKADPKKKEETKKADPKKEETKKTDSKKEETKKTDSKKKEETKKTETKKDDPKKKEETKKADPKKKEETKKTETKKTDSKKEETKRKSEEGECPHAKKAREEKAKKEKAKKESDSKSKTEDSKKKDSKSTKQTKKSEL